MSKFIEDFRREVVVKGVIQDLESKLPKAYRDFANKAADYISFNYRKLVKECETFQQLQKVVRQRYSKVQNALESLARKPPSEKRFCDACTKLNKAIAISIQNGDTSVELSECLVTGMKILLEPPRKSRCFNKEQRDNIVKSGVSFFRAYAEYLEMFYPFVHKMGDFNDLSIDIPLCIKEAKGNSLHKRVADIIFDNPSAGKYNFNGVAFEKLAKSLECMALPKHPREELLHYPLEAFFSREVLYFGNLLNANGIRYVLTDPSRMIGCIEKQIEDLNNKPKIIRTLREYKDWEAIWENMLRDAGSDEAKRREYLEKLEKTRSDRVEFTNKCRNDYGLDVKAIEELEAQVAPVTDAQQNGNEHRFMGKDLDYLENSPAPVSIANQNEEDCPMSRAKKQNISSGKRKRWKSKYAGKRVRDVIDVDSADRNGYTTHFYVGEYRFQLTAGKAGELLDRMIEKQEKACKSKQERLIPFSKGKRNLFKDLKCINPKGKDLEWFFTEIIYLEHGEHGKITRAGFNEDLFPKSS